LVLAGAAVVDWPAGTLVPSLTSPNLPAPEAVTKALAAAAERAGAGDGGPASVVIPDPVIRTASIPASEVGKARASELQELARFRMRKSLPFDVHEARVAVLRPPRDGEPSLAVVARASVLDEYEAAASTCGFAVGVVEPAALALTATLSDDDDLTRLLVNWDDGYVSFVVLRGDWPLVVRTVVGDLTADPGELVREARSTLIYCREKLDGLAPKEALFRSAFRPAEEAMRRLGEDLELPVTPIALKDVAGVDLGSEQRMSAALSALFGRAA